METLQDSERQGFRVWGLGPFFDIFWWLCGRFSIQDLLGYVFGFLWGLGLEALKAYGLWVSGFVGLWGLGLGARQSTMDIGPRLRVHGYHAIKTGA